MDISDIGAFNYEWDFDKDDYLEYLQDNEMEDTQENLIDYIKDNVSFEIELLDNETFHVFDRKYLCYDEIEDIFDERLAKRVLEDCMDDGHGSVETMSLYNDEIDVNNSEELNAAAKKLLQHGSYYKNCRGFILSDGTVVYTPSEHNECSRIYGVEGTFHFIRLGNIRILQNSIDIGKKPTEEQYETLRDVIRSYSDGELYLDILSNNISVKYVRPQWRYVIGEIERFYDEGIKPSGHVFYEENKTKPMKVILSEDKLSMLKNLILKEGAGRSEDKVSIVKSYLDNNFIRTYTTIMKNGEIAKKEVVGWLGPDKKVVKLLSDEELFYLLQEKFKNIIADREERDDFLKDMLKSWYYNKISKNNVILR